MPSLLDSPVLVLLTSLLGLWLAGWLGGRLRAIRKGGPDAIEDDFSLITGGALTLLGLIIGFTFSMAVSRYDQRKNLEEQEANAIGTEYARADLLPPADAAKVRSLLKAYAALRIRYFETRNGQDLARLDAETIRLQGELWSAAAVPALANPTPVAALVVSGMNDVLNSQGYTQAAWWNRIPVAAWALLVAIGVFCNLLVGYTTVRRGLLFHLILPVVLAITLFLIADIDSPRGGVIRVHPQNLEAAVSSFGP